MIANNLTLLLKHHFEKSLDDYEARRGGKIKTSPLNIEIDTAMVRMLFNRAFEIACVQYIEMNSYFKKETPEKSPY